MEKKPYIAYPKKVKTDDDIEQLCVMRNKFAEESGFPKYIAFKSEVDLKCFLDFSCPEFKWFVEDNKRLSRIGVGESIKEAVDNLLGKINSKEVQLQIKFS